MSRETPDIVKALEDKIVDWDYTVGGILIHPKDALVKELLVKYIPVSIGFELKTEFICPTVVVREADMDTAHCSKYRKLKGLECEILWRGFARKKVEFKTHKELLELQSLILELKMGNELIDTLNSNSELVSLISSLRPDDLAVTLDSINNSDISYIQSKEDMLEHKVRFFQKPTKITWLTKVSMMLIRRPGYQKRAENLIRILHLISHDVVCVSDRLQ